MPAPLSLRLSFFMIFHASLPPHHPPIPTSPRPPSLLFSPAPPRPPQAVMDEILMLQDEIGEPQTCFSEELCCDGGRDSDRDGGDPGDQLALQSTLTLLGGRMATIRMKASGKRQLLEVGGPAMAPLAPARRHTI